MHFDLKPNPEWATRPPYDRTGWKRVGFGDVFENRNETCELAEARSDRFVAIEPLKPGSLHVRSWGDRWRCRSGQALFGGRRAYQRMLAEAEFEALVSSDIYLIELENPTPATGIFCCSSASPQ